MTANELSSHYRRYIACLNKRHFDDLDAFTHDTIIYNDKIITRDEFRDLLATDVNSIPDLYYDVAFLVTQADMVAARLNFNCTPQKQFLRLRPNGRPVSFSEHVFYQFRDNKIAVIWSLIDRSAIEQQLNAER